MFPRALSLACCVVVLAVSFPSDARSQDATMREVLNQLFVFGEGDDPLFLVGSAGVPATEVHGDHFIPSETEANATLLSFFNNSISTNLSSFPLSSTVASQTFTFVQGVPTPSSTSFGPIFAERAQTVGRGRLNAGVNFSRLRFSELRGIDLDDLQFSFVHTNVDFPNCDQIFQTDCSQFGAPQFENDVIDLFIDLDIEADVFAFFATFGVTDWMDISVAVPVVDLELAGVSRAVINVTTGDEANHFFGGTPTDPDLEATSRSSGQTTGIGDVATRLKVRALSGDIWQLGVLGEVRAPTGDEDDFLSTGDVNARGLLIISGMIGDFSPHLNAGFEYRGDDLDENEVEIVAGFDHRLADWATLAVDFLGTFEVQDERLLLPQPTQFEAPFERTVRLTNIPDRDDDILDGSIGFKFRTASGVVVITNVLVPLNDGGLRSSPIPTLGIEYTL